MSCSSTFSGISVNRVRHVEAPETWEWEPRSTDAAAWEAPIQEAPPLSIDEMKMREQRMHVDHVHDMVPFWIRGVEAAKKGEVLRLEEFLETLWESRDAWSNAGSAWKEDLNGGGGASGWGKNAGADGWGAVEGDNAWGRGVGGNGWGVSSANRWPDETTSPGREAAPAASCKRQSPRRSERNNKRQYFARKGGTKQWNRGGGQDAHAFVEGVVAQQAMDDRRKNQMHSFYDMPTDEKVKKIDEVIHALRST